MKLSTKDGKKKLAPQTARVIRQSHGLRADIARAGGFHRSYVTRVLSGAKPPSARFLEALSVALEAMARHVQIETVRLQYPREFAATERECGARR